MSNLAYLGIAAAFSIVLSVIVWLARYRKPKTFMSSIDDFQREMGALGGDVDPKTKRRATRLEPIVPAPEQGDLARKLKEARDDQSYDEYYLDEER
jgi:type III secretory pathway component EscU